MSLVRGQLVCLYLVSKEDRVVDDWLDNVSDGNLTSVCSFDITKCFDTINHAILLKKMSFYGFNYHTSKWFQSYLNKREQIVSCRNQLSGKCQILSTCTLLELIKSWT